MTKQIIRTLLICMIFCLLLSGCNSKQQTHVPKPLPTIERENTDMEYPKEPVFTADSLVYNIEDFGGNGNGRQDNSEALTAALECVSQAGGGTILFPRGTYRFTSPIVIDNLCTGTIMLTSNSSGSDAVTLTSGKDIDTDFITITAPNVHLNGIRIQNSSQKGASVHFASEKCVMTGCSVNQNNKNNPDAAIVVSGSGNKIGNCSFVGVSSIGYVMRITKLPGRECRNNSVTDSYFGGSMPKSLLINTQDSGNSPKETFISRNVFLFPAPGQIYVVAAESLSILNNMLDAATTSIMLNPDATGIKNVEIKYNYMGSSTYGVTGYEDRTDPPGGVVCDITNGGKADNVIIADNYSWCYYGVRIPSSNFTNFTIVNNYFVEANAAALYIKDCVNCRIEGNIFCPGSEAEYTIYIEKIDADSIIKNNTAGGKIQIPNLDDYKEDNFFG